VEVRATDDSVGTGIDAGGNVNVKVWIALGWLESIDGFFTVHVVPPATYNETFTVPPLKVKVPGGKSGQSAPAALGVGLQTDTIYR